MPELTKKYSRVIKIELEKKIHIFFHMFAIFLKILRILQNVPGENVIMEIIKNKEWDSKTTSTRMV